MSRAWLRLGCATALLVGGCTKREETATDAAPAVDEALPKDDAESIAVPTDREGFLRLFARLPDAPLHVHYTVSGPRMNGNLDLWLDEGGYRREAWDLEMPSSLEEGADLVAVSGLAIQTPETLWSATAGEPGVKTDSPLSAIAEHYVSLSAEDRQAVAQTLRTWAEAVDEARSESPGTTETIAGIECLEMHVASQDLCLWERAGLPLRYRGDVFVLEAETVERHAELPARAFELPVGAADATTQTLEQAGLAIDPKEAIEQLKSGNPGVNALALTPAFRLPTPAP